MWQVLCYEPRWLLLGLETVFGEIVPVPTQGSGGGIGRGSKVDRALRSFVGEVCGALESSTSSTVTATPVLSVLVYSCPFSPNRDRRTTSRYVRTHVGTMSVKIRV